MRSGRAASTRSSRSSPRSRPAPRRRLRFLALQRREELVEVGAARGEVEADPRSREALDAGARRADRSRREPPASPFAVEALARERDVGGEMLDRQRHRSLRHPHVGEPKSSFDGGPLPGPAMPWMRASTSSGCGARRTRTEDRGSATASNAASRSAATRAGMEREIDPPRRRAHSRSTVPSSSSVASSMIDRELRRSGPGRRRARSRDRSGTRRRWWRSAALPPAAAHPYLAEVELTAQRGALRVARHRPRLFRHRLETFGHRGEVEPASRASWRQQIRREVRRSSPGRAAERIALVSVRPSGSTAPAQARLLGVGEPEVERKCRARPLGVASGREVVELEIEWAEDEVERGRDRPILDRDGGVLRELERSMTSRDVAAAPDALGRRRPGCGAAIARSPRRCRFRSSRSPLLE